MRIRIIDWLTWWWALLIAAGPFTAAGAASLPFIVSEPRENLAAAIWLLEDPAGSLTLEDIQSPVRQRQFTAWDAARGDLNLSYSGSTWWIRVRLQRAPGAPDAWILNVPDAYSKFIDFHAPGMPVVYTGHARPPDQRPLLSPHFAFPVQLSDTPQDFYFRVASHYAVSFPLKAWQVKAYSRYTLNERLLQALYHGALFSMVVYALFIWLSSRDSRFGLYAAYGSALSLGMLSGNGWGGLLLWPDWRRFDEVASGLFLSLTVSALVLLARSVLRTRETVPAWMDRAAWGAAGLGALHALAMLAAVGNAHLTALMFKSLPWLGLTAITLIALISWRVRAIDLPGKRYFVLSWLALGLGVIVGAMRLLGWAPTNILTSYAIQIATSIEMLLMSFMLAGIIREERQQRLAAQSRLIDALRAQESRLERSVEERTRALSAAADSERRTLSEYLRFAALVSHEFRNGLNVISAQSDVLQKQTVDTGIRSRAQVINQQVVRLAKITDTWLKSDQILNSPSPPRIEAIDCRDMIEKTLQSSPDGFNDHRITWHIADDATTIWADRNLLDVALMNLLSNACKYSPPHSPIEIRTCSMRTEAGIAMTGLRVTDRGEGIEPSLQARVFERYFRVRPEGLVSGIGLGLSFVRHIAEQHRGHIDLVSQPGDGSMFTIWFPDRDPPKHP